MLFKICKIRDGIILKRFKEFDKYYCKNCKNFKSKNCEYEDDLDNPIAILCNDIYDWWWGRGNGKISDRDKPLYSYVYYPL